MSSRFDELSAFVEVARRHSFVGAARQLDKHVSAVSRAVATLEARLGVRLLQRTTRSVALTEAGRDYFQRGEALLAEFDGAEAAVRDLGASLRGTLRVSAASGSGVIQIAGLVPEFLAAHPHLQLDLQLGNRYVDLIEEGYDLAIRVGALADSRLIARKLAPNRRVLVASPAWLERHGRPRTPAALQRHACLVLDIGTHPQRWQLVRRGAEEHVDARGPLRSNNVLALLAACRGDAGIALLPEFAVAADLRAGRLRRVLAGWATPEHGVYAVYPSARFVPAKVRAFIDFIAQRLRAPTVDA
ncbi:MAG: LysR family transcriptional regulator [Proteobacteria bacterium]|uniref:LysR family transcriptional regulator n=1 Tax=Rudaea sp. TaxID=2136325 RepID=UPI00321FAF44|nr:LysR family transcriptional regulator [Pseudomonadota bacterium]